MNNLHSLSLGANQLSGTIPAELGNLNNLLALALSANQLSGTIPPNSTTCPASSTWIFPKNQLMGEIPAELGNLNNLGALYLNNNQLSGTIPAELGNLTNLQRLRLDGTTGLCLASDFPLTSPFAMRSLYLPVCTTGDGPGPPRNLVADGGNEQITLSWDAPGERRRDGDHGLRVPDRWE